MSDPTNMLTITCSKCGKQYRVPVSAVGKRGKCKGCGETMEIRATPSDEVPMVEVPTPAPSAEEPLPPALSSEPVDAAAASAKRLAYKEAFERKKAALKKKRIIIGIAVAGALLFLVVTGFLLPSGGGGGDASGIDPAKMKEFEAEAEAAKPTTDLLASPDAKVRLDAAKALGQHPEWRHASVPKMQKAFAKEQDNDVRTELEAALKGFHAPLVAQP